MKTTFDSNIIVVGSTKGRELWEKAEEENISKLFKEKFNKKIISTNHVKNIWCVFK